MNKWQVNIRLFPLRSFCKNGYPTFWGYLNQSYGLSLESKNGHTWLSPSHGDIVSYERIKMTRWRFFKRYFFVCLVKAPFQFYKIIKVKSWLWFSYNIYDLSANAKNKRKIKRRDLIKKYKRKFIALKNKF